MNVPLSNALAALKRSGAQNLPSEGTVLSARDGSHWEGTKGSGDPWGLIKNGQESFNVIC